MYYLLFINCHATYNGFGKLPAHGNMLNTSSGFSCRLSRIGADNSIVPLYSGTTLLITLTPPLSVTILHSFLNNSLCTTNKSHFEFHRLLTGYYSTDPLQISFVSPFVWRTVAPLHLQFSIVHIFKFDISSR